MSVFTEISIVTDGEAAEAVADVLRPYAYQNSVVLEQLGDPHDLDPLALQDEVTVKIFISEEEDTADLRQKIKQILYHLNRLYPVPPPVFKKIPETDWANAWKENFHPFRVGERLWIIPSWTEPEELQPIISQEYRSDTVELFLDPGMAFGTGTHPTTQKCLMALEQLVQEGFRVLDVGTGSGILSIAAAKLGAQEVVGIDTDSLAVQAAVTNAEQNGVEQVTRFFQGELADITDRDWDVVVVNILAPVIIDLIRKGDLINFVGENGWLILSGINDLQVADVESAVASVGAHVEDKMIIRDWVTLIVRRH